MKGTLKLFFAAVLAISIASCASQQTAEKEIYIPKDLADIDFNDSTARYCYKHSLQGENVAIFWESGFGDDPRTAPEYKDIDMKVDIDNLLAQAEYFYDLYRNTHKFIGKGSKADQYKMMIMLNYSDEGVAYGGDYDGVIGALWVTPLRTRDPRMNCIAHELGHSFQMQLGIDSESGFGGGGIYEMTAQWQLWQANILWVDDEKYHWDDFMKQTHFAFMHPANMYHSPYVLEYWSTKRGVEFIGDLWRAAKHRRDVVEVYQSFTEMTQDQFNAEIFEAGQLFMTYDLPRVKETMKKYANMHQCEFQAADAEGWHRIAESRTPQQYGYNGIALQAPKAGETVKVEFRGETTEANAGWRYGFVGVRENGEAVYGEMNTDAATEASFTADEDLAHLWLVVTAAPTEHIKFTEEDAETCASYPYSIRLTGSKLLCEVK